MEAINIALASELSRHYRRSGRLIFEPPACLVLGLLVVPVDMTILVVVIVACLFASCIFFGRV